MPIFQGSGFSIDVPEDCVDASTYTYLIPSKSQFGAYVTIKFERYEDVPDLLDYAENNENLFKDNVENFTVIDKQTGLHADCDVVMTLLEWGPEESRITQRQVYFLIADESKRIYTFTGTDLKENFSNSEKYFNHMLKTFSPNKKQVFSGI